MTTGDAWVLLVWVVLWLVVVALVVRRERKAVPTPTPEALAGQARYLERLQAMRAAAALEALAEETERRHQAAPPQPVGLRLTGTDERIVEQLIEVTRGVEPRRSLS